MPCAARSRIVRCPCALFRNDAIRPFGLVIILCLVGLLAGCVKKVAPPPGIPFDLDKVFANKITAPEEDWKAEGIRLWKDKDLPQAIEAFEHYVEQEPEDFFGFNAIAVCYKNLGDQAKAMKNYERALEFADSPEDKAKVLANIGNLYSSARKEQVALGYYKEAAKDFAPNPLYLIYIARTFVRLNDYDRARKVLSTAEKIQKGLGKYESDNEKGLGSFLMAYCYAGLSDEKKVFEYLKKALKANPEGSVKRIKRALTDQKSLLYTLKGDERLMKLLQPYETKNLTGERHEGS
jgi:tetratricopeptide (TPR) repeat protein